jgi:hypothetical protein
MDNWVDYYTQKVNLRKVIQSFHDHSNQGVIFFLTEGGSLYLAQAGLEFTILLLQIPKYWITGMSHHTQVRCDT